MLYRNIYLIFLSFCIISASAQSEYTTSVDSLFFPSDFFEQTTPFSISIETNISKLQQKKFHKKYSDADLLYVDVNGDTIRRLVSIKTRGIARLNICHYPPLWINFKKSGIVCDNLEGNKVKIVTRCKSGDVFEEYLLKEYLAYKIFNIITDNSFRVRLIHVDINDPKKAKKSYSGWGFVIEPEKLMAKRLLAYAYKRDNLSFKHTDPLQTDIMSFFQYLIGNTDFEVNNRHNVKILKPSDYKKPLVIPVPYDFDYAGLVDAGYALPAEVLNISDVKDRYYVGMCRDEDRYDYLIELFKEKEGQIVDLISEFEYLDQKVKDEMLLYINGFYNEIKNPELIKKSIKSTCR